MFFKFHSQIKESYPHSQLLIYTFDLASGDVSSMHGCTIMSPRQRNLTDQKIVRQHLLPSYVVQCVIIVF